MARKFGRRLAQAPVACRAAVHELAVLLTVEQSMMDEVTPSTNLLQFLRRLKSNSTPQVSQ